MPVLKNARHELFCQNLAKGMTQTEAYTAAGYKDSPLSRMHANRLATKEYIRIRVAELMSRNIQKQDEMVAITTERLVVLAEEARQKAMSERGGAAAAIQALTAIAKLTGRWIEKSETTTKTDDLSSMSDAELAAIVRQGQPKPAPLNPEAKKLN
jgi:phage terminase small subunit